jgi:hypothetical protein
MAVLKAAKEPKRSVMAFASSPVGSPPPPLPLGARFSQKMLWFTCPPPLKRMAPWSAIIDATSPVAWASAYLPSAALRLVTYALWCLVWWRRMMSPEMKGSRAP